MRTTIVWFTIMACVLLQLSCDKDYCDGTSSAIKDGEIWEADLIVNDDSEFLGDNCFTIELNKYSPEGFLREQFAIANVPQEEKVFTFSKSVAGDKSNVFAMCSYATYGSHGDVVTSIYWAISNDVDNFVEVTSKKRKKISGIFNATLVLDSLYRANDPSLPDTVRFKDGVFESDD